MEKKRKQEEEKTKFKKLKKYYDQLLLMRKIQLGIAPAQSFGYGTANVGKKRKGD